MENVVRIDRDKRGQPTPLDVLTELTKADMQRVNQVIMTRMQSPVALIPQLAGHLIASGGKRLRPSGGQRRE